MQIQQKSFKKKEKKVNTTIDNKKKNCTQLKLKNKKNSRKDATILINLFS